MTRLNALSKFAFIWYIMKWKVYPALNKTIQMVRRRIRAT